MKNQGKSNKQLKDSYIGASIGMVGIFIMLIYLVLS